MTKFQRQRINEMRERIEAAAAPLEEKADTFMTKLIASKWTWAFLVLAAFITLVAIYNSVF